MEYVLICQSLFVQINHSDKLSVVNCTPKPYPPLPLLSHLYSSLKFSTCCGCVCSGKWAKDSWSYFLKDLIFQILFSSEKVDLLQDSLFTFNGNWTRLSGSESQSLNAYLLASLLGFFIDLIPKTKLLGLVIIESNLSLIKLRFKPATVF